MKSIAKSNISKAVIIALIIVPTMLLFQSSQLKGGKDLKIGKKAPMTSTNLTGVDGKQLQLV